MRSGFSGIPSKCSLVVSICSSIKGALMTFYEKHNIENKWPNIQVRNKSTSVE